MCQLCAALWPLPDYSVIVMFIHHSKITHVSQRALSYFDSSTGVPYFTPSVQNVNTAAPCADMDIILSISGGSQCCPAATKEETFSQRL